MEERPVMIPGVLRCQPFFTLSVLQIAYGGLLVSSQVFPKVYLQYCGFCHCEDALNTHCVGVFFLVAGLLLMLVSNPKKKIRCWLVFASYFVFIAHAVSTVYLAVQAYVETYLTNCDLFLLLFLYTGIGSLVVICIALLALLFYCCKTFGNKPQVDTTVSTGLSRGQLLSREARPMNIASIL